MLTRRTSAATMIGMLIVAFVAVVTLSNALLGGARLDLTAGGLYTLSDGTRAILKKIDEPIRLRFFYSEHLAADAPPLRAYGTRVRELLEEVAAVADGGIVLEIIDPPAFSEAEDRASAAGLTAVPAGPGGENFFFGLTATSATDEMALIPFFQPDKETFIEYDIAKLIQSVAQPARPVVGVIAGLDMAPGFDPASGGPREGFAIDTEMRRLFDLRPIPSSASGIETDVELLMVVHPRDLPEPALAAIDQFVLRGGRLLVFVDPFAESQPAESSNDPQSALMADRASTLGPLFKHWGLQFDPTRVVLDARNALQIQAGEGGKTARHPAILGLGLDDLDQADVVSAELESINLSTAGALALADGSPLTLEPLIQSSDAANTTDADRLKFLTDPESLFADFKPSGERLVLAARLTGELTTAFPDRKADNWLTKSVKPANIIVVADTDLLTDRLWVQASDFFGQRLLNAFANNGDFIINAVDNLVGSADLIAVRARGRSSRPFDRVDALERGADERFRAKERELETELSATEKRLAALKASRDESGQPVLSADQQAELGRFEAEKVRIRRELRAVRRELAADIEALGARLRFINILLVPILLTIVVLVVYGMRRRRPRRPR